MKKNKNKLTASEENLMEIFWNASAPLTSVEILEDSSTHDWNNSYIHNMLRALQKKGFIKVCGTKQYGTQYAREFIPTRSREEYAAQLALGLGLQSASIAKVTVAMVEQSTHGADVISSLEDIIATLKSKEE